jgi:prophage regulatory protein
MATVENQQRQLPLESADPALPTKIRILRLAEVRDVTGLCRSSIYQLQAQKRFPQSVKINQRSVGWVEAAVQQWLEEKVRQSQR